VLQSWEDEGDTAGSGWGNPLVFPTMFRQSDIWSAMHWRVPADDSHTEIYVAHFKPSEDGKPVTQPEEPPLEDPPPQTHPSGEYTMNTFYSQDKMAWETQGEIFNRAEESAGLSDRGILMYRMMLKEQIELVQKGGDPMNTIRNPDQNTIIDLEGWCSERDTRAGAGHQGMELSRVRRRDEVFDDRHEVFEVPFGTARPRPE
jgi:5,5'-dehydrodivanillate O-demethylase